MAKRIPARRKRQPTISTHAQMLRPARQAEAKGDKEKATLIRKLAKDRFRAVMTYGLNRSFARLLTDEEIVALPPQEAVPMARGSPTSSSPFGNGRVSGDARIASALPASARGRTRVCRILALTAHPFLSKNALNSI